MTASELTIKNVDAGYLGIIPDTFRHLGIEFSISNDDIHIPAQEHYRIQKFTEFPEIVEKHRPELEDKTVVTFCTGGIRCEKAAIHMQNVGYEHVYQLEGGILKYFEEVGGAHYHGDCFVFDYRTALNPQLEATDTKQCFACRAVITPRQQLSPWYVPGKSCPICKKEHSGRAEPAAGAGV